MPVCTRRLLLLAALLLPACGRPPEVPARQLIVFATLYPLADIARQVGGDRVRIDWLVDSGDPIETFTLSEADRTRMSGVDLILADGTGRTEVWAQREIDRRRETGSVGTVDQTPSAWQAPSGGLLVLDPTLAAEYAHFVAKLLSRRLPSEANLFRQRAEAYAAELERTAASFTAPPGPPVMVLSELFQPLLARFGVRTTLVSADPLRFTAKDADAVRRSADDSGAKVLIVPFDTPPGTRTHLEELTGLRVFALDALGYPNYEQHSSYLDVLKYNLEQLRVATG